MKKPLLELFNLSKSYGTLKAVDQISMTIEKGQIVGLLGPNGSGKSTTLGMVLQVVNPTSGSFRWFGGRLNNHQALQKVGALIERPNFYPYLSAYDNLRLVCKIKNCPETAIEKQLQLVGLWERKNDRFKNFSLGMKQRLAIASALLNDPELLILDEPTNGLDPEGIHQIRQLIGTIAKHGTTIVLASHLLDEVEKICSHVIVLKNGIQQYQGKVDELTHSHGFFELKGADMKKLETFLQQTAEVDRVTSENGLLLAYLSASLPADELCKRMVASEIYPEHLVKRKPSLEDQFLTLTKNA
ncbi:MAG: ABC transporter ATP-binding protein [Flavobacteriaceae bacterium]